MDRISLTTQLSEQEYIKANLYLVYRKWTGKFFLGMGLFTLLCVLFLYFTGALTDIPWVGLLFGFYFTLGFPGQIYFAAKKSYKTDKRVSEPMVYDFNRENIQITGESFQTKLSWDKVYSLTESKAWVLLWSTPQVANIIPKRDFSPAQLRFFKEIAQAQKGPKNFLKF
ncbi:YcxB family protein [Rufibacter sediminis]|uniref:YcxB family protein n=1 Tax=Rufibacter sediminis TaxID=2762756 RepID=A0ABR6VVD7_9BACT|nr:YcxB family protein [Rufibacter sediminis]MBC3541124.1 YcxB family protein [Rufibacter sediminis]